MFGDLGKILKLAGEMKRRLPELKERLAASLYTAEAGGGAVRATVNGRLQLTDLKFSESLRADGSLSLDVLEDLVRAAVASAQAQALRAAEDAMKELTGGVDIAGLGDML